MSNHEVFQKQPLLNKEGRIIEEGWARFPVWVYERSKIKSNFLKVKEWDYYLIHNIEDKWFVSATISDLDYAGLMSISFIDCKNNCYNQSEVLKFLTRGKLGLSSSTTDDNYVCFSNEKIRLTFIKNKDEILLSLASSELDLDANFEIKIVPFSESVNIATSWKENRRAFYLNEKKNCMRTSGRLRIKEKDFNVSPENTFTTLDWGRGRWTRENTWYWGSGSGILKSSLFGFNLGYGFTDRSPASENAIFYNNKIHKIEDVIFNIPDNYMDKWYISSSDGRFEADFFPSVDRTSNIKNIIAQSSQHQVFGSFYGKAVLDNGEVLDFNDFTGFLEKVYNKW